MMSDKGILIQNVYHMLAYAFQVLKQGNYEEAIAIFEEYDGNDDIIAPKVKHALGNCYSHKREDTHFVLEMEDGIRQWIEQCFYHEALAKKYNEDNGLKPSDADYHPITNPARDLRNWVGHYFSSIRLLDGVFVIDSKYYDEVSMITGVPAKQ